MLNLFEYFRKDTSPKLTPLEKEVSEILKALQGTGFLVEKPVPVRQSFTILKAPKNLNFKEAWLERVTAELDNHGIGLWKADKYVQALGHKYVLVRGNLMIPIEPF
jgi:hypothetical protein